MFTQQFFEGGPVRLNFAAGPASGSPLLFLHGSTRRWQDFLTLAPMLVPRWHVHALDFRAHGRSSRTPARAACLYGKRSGFLLTMAGEGDREKVGDVWRDVYEMQPLNDPQGILQLEPGPEVKGRIVVEATLHVVHHPRHAAGPVDVQAFVEYRLVDAVQAGR